MHLLVVGDGELRQLAMAQANRSRLPVTFAGFLNQSHMARAYTAADCLVLPSDHGETWGLVVNEAMACGLPAIVSDRVGCGQDLVVEGVTGFTFPFANVARLADLMTDCALDPVRLGELGSRAREHVRAYSIENAARATLDAVRYVTGIR